MDYLNDLGARQILALLVGLPYCLVMQAVYTLSLHITARTFTISFNELFTPKFRLSPVSYLFETKLNSLKTECTHLLTK